MSLAQRFERRLEGVVGSAFARVFKGQVEPVEIGNALQREAGDKHAIMGSGQILAPNRYRVSLATSDYERLAPWDVQLCNSLAELVQEYLDENDWATVGDIEVLLHHDDTLHTGVFGVASRMEPEAPPRRRPYDSLSMPVVPGVPPGQYEHPFGSPVAAGAVPGLGDAPAADHDAFDHHGAPEPPLNFDPGAPQHGDPYGQPARQPVPYGQPTEQDPYGQPAHQPYPQTPTGYAQPGELAQQGAPGYPGAYAQPGGGPQYGQDPYAQAPADLPPGPPPCIEPRRVPQVRGILVIDGSPTHLVLRRGSNIIGRGHDADLQVLDQGVSRRHVDVQFDDGVAVAYDLGSTNGTSVNGHEIGNRQLQHGDVVRVGHTRIVYHQETG